MKIGDYITSKSYVEKGKGRIIDIIEISDTTTYSVFFDSTKEVLSLNKNDVTRIKDPLEKIKENNFDNPLLFPIRVFSEGLESLFYQDKIISACNFFHILFTSLVTILN